MSNKTKKQQAVKIFNVDDLHKLDPLYFGSVVQKANVNPITHSIPKGRTKTELSFMRGFR